MEGDGLRHREINDSEDPLSVAQQHDSSDEDALAFTTEGPGHNLEEERDESSDLIGPPETDPASNHKKMLWRGVSWVMLADVIGTGILSFNQVAAQLGWVPLLICLVLFAGLSLTSAVLLKRTFIILQSFGINVKTMGEAAFHVLGGRKAYIFVTVLVYGYAFMGNATYLLVLSQNIQSVVYDLDVSLLVAVSVAGSFLLPFLFFIKHISESIWLCFGNLLLLIGVLALGIGVLITRERTEEVVTEIFARTLSVGTFFQASTAVLYAYAGHWMYFELLSSMEQPQDFTKVLSVNVPIQFCLYTITACVTYAYVGREAGINGIIQEMPEGIYSRIANVCLFLHVAIVYIIKSVIIITFIQDNIFKSTTWIGRHIHWRIRQVALALTFVLSNAVLACVVPYFYQFLGLVGALFAVPISYLLPVIFYLAARGRFANLAPTKELTEVPRWTSEVLTYPEIICFCVLYVLVLSVTVASTYSQISDIILLSRLDS